MSQQHARTGLFDKTLISTVNRRVGGGPAGNHLFAEFGEVLDGKLQLGVTLPAQGCLVPYVGIVIFPAKAEAVPYFAKGTKKGWVFQHLRVGGLTRPSAFIGI